jgi:hypothetical protein
MRRQRLSGQASGPLPARQIVGDRALGVLAVKALPDMRRYVAMRKM